MRAAVEAKAGRYLSEGRLVVTRISVDSVAAECRGASDVYALGYSSHGWWCSCPSRATCSHIVALQRVTTTFKRASVVGARNEGSS